MKAVSGYRGRIAPSPTGMLHVGSARTALVAWLAARHGNGTFVLRVEDLDPPRVVPGAEEAIARDLLWLGLDWDEGPDRSGPYGPYRQSERLALYNEALDRLIRAGHVYPCTCTRKEVAAFASAPHGIADLGPRYPGTCRNGPTHPERPAGLRFKMPEPAPVVHDGLMGTYTLEANVGDFLVRRADGLHAYQLAVVVDDIAMKITEVVRGADLLSSTPGQIALYRALGAEPPAFVHVPLVLGADGARLAKRHGSISITELRDAGMSAEDVIGRLGYSLGLLDRDEPVCARDLLAHFVVSRIKKTPHTLE